MKDPNGYPDGESDSEKKSYNTNPHNPTKMVQNTTLFAYDWHPLYISGKIPRLYQNLKLFFSAPCIADGAWIQFHGPGTKLYDTDPTFKVYLGSLCDPEKRGSFTSLASWTNAGYRWVELTFTSEYSVSIKWEH